MAAAVRREDKRVHCGSGFLHVVAIHANLSMRQREMERIELPSKLQDQQGMQPSHSKKVVTVSVPVMSQSRISIVAERARVLMLEEQEATETEQVLDSGVFRLMPPSRPAPPPWHQHGPYNSVNPSRPPLPALMEPFTPLYQHLNKLID